MDQFCKTGSSGVLDLVPKFFHSALQRRSYDIRLWQVSPDGTLTSILPYSSSVCFDFVYEQMFSVEQICPIVGNFL